MISILIPVLNRPWRAAEVTGSILRSGAVDVQVVFLVSTGDDEQLEACLATGAYSSVVPWLPGAGDYARKINHGAKIAGGEWLFLGADDLCFCPGWDTEAMKVAEKTGAKVIGTDDLWNPLVKQGLHSTHTFVEKRYALDVGCSWDDTPGLVYHEGYSHQYVDTELVAVAKQRRVWAFSKRSKVEHLHTLAGKSPNDSTYVKALADGAADRDIYKRRLVAA